MMYVRAYVLYVSVPSRSAMSCARTAGRYVYAHAHNSEALCEYVFLAYIHATCPAECSEPRSQASCTLEATSLCCMLQNHAHTARIYSRIICAVAEGVAPWSAVVARGSRDQNHFRNESSDQVIFGTAIKRSRLFL